MAQVDDSWTAVFDAAPNAVLHVDQNHPSASDSNPGTPDLPLKTIGKGTALAVTNKGAGTNTQILVSPAVYREAVTVGYSFNPAYITLEGTGPGVVISGSDVFDDWTLTEGNIWETPWTEAWGPLDPWGWPDPPDVLLRREMVFDQGELLRQVLAYTDLHIGSFFVDETAEKLYVWPHDDLDFVEVAMRDRALWVHGIDYVKVKNITAKHATPEGIGFPALTAMDSNHIMLEDCVGLDNSQAGVSFWNVTDCVGRNIEARRNGVLGVGASRMRDCSIDGVSASENNWRGDWGGEHDWATGGCKAQWNHNVIHRNYKVHDNLARGFWADTDWVDVATENIECWGNFWDNLFLENLQGPLEISGARIWNGAGYGLHTEYAANVTLRDVHIFNNADGQLIVGNWNQGSESVTIQDYETGEDAICVSGKDWTMEGVFLHGQSPLLRRDFAGPWEAMPGLVARGVHFFKGDD